jgi:hypothetical protein
MREGELDERGDPPYLVPTHLSEAQSVGPIPVRTFYVVLLVGLLVAAPFATVVRQLWGDVALWLALLPLMLASPLAMPWLRPPAEHGLVRLTAHLYRRATGGCVLGIANQPDLASVRASGGAIQFNVARRTEWRAIYTVQTVNLDTASAASRRAVRARWGTVLNGLSHPIQIVVHARPAGALPVVQRIRQHGTHSARVLADWLAAHLFGAQLVYRERLLVIPAPDQQTLEDRCASIEAAMRRIGLPIARIKDDDRLIRRVAEFLTPRPGRNRVGPTILDITPSGHLVADGQYVSSFAVGALPASITTDWAAPLLDGDLPVDVALDIEPLDVRWAKFQLDTRRNALESSPPTPARTVALEQITGLRMAYERRETLPLRMTVTCALRTGDLVTLNRSTQRLKQRMRDLGAVVRPLRWEQREGWLAVAPIRREPSTARGLNLETGSIARTYPFSAATLHMEGGVPFGVAGAAPVTFTTAHPRNKNHHMCWYGTSGAGKGYSLRVLLSRERFANGLRTYVIDQDEQQEYAGRFCQYLGGSTVQIRSVDEARQFAASWTETPYGRGRWSADVLVWDLHESDERERGAIFSILKTALGQHVLAYPGRAAVVVDEAVTLADDADGERALGDLIRRGRHFGLEVHVLTQRVSDWFDTRIGRTIQSVAASRWFGQMEPRELYEIGPSLGLSADECDRIERAGQGEGLLVTAGQRVWVNLYGHTSPEEYAMANTDPEMPSATAPDQLQQ